MLYFFARARIAGHHRNARACFFCLLFVLKVRRDDFYPDALEHREDDQNDDDEYEKEEEDDSRSFLPPGCCLSQPRSDGVCVKTTHRRRNERHVGCVSQLERESEGTSSQNDASGGKDLKLNDTPREKAERIHARDDGNRAEQQRATFTTRELYHQREQQDDEEETIFAPPRFFYFERRRRFRER